MNSRALGPPPKKYVMPDLAYRNADEVGPWLEQFGFRAQIRPTPTNVQGQPDGTIITHDPSWGFPVTEGDVITLRVNR